MKTIILSFSFCLSIGTISTAYGMQNSQESNEERLLRANPGLQAMIALMNDSNMRYYDIPGTLPMTAQMCEERVNSLENMSDVEFAAAFASFKRDCQMARTTRSLNPRMIELESLFFREELRRQNLARVNH